MLGVIHTGIQAYRHTDTKKRLLQQKTIGVLSTACAFFVAVPDNSNMACKIDYVD